MREPYVQWCESQGRATSLATPSHAMRRWRQQCPRNAEPLLGLAEPRYCERGRICAGSTESHQDGLGVAAAVRIWSILGGLTERVSAVSLQPSPAGDIERACRERCCNFRSPAGTLLGPLSARPEDARRR